jgi:flagellar basal body-associated protein FliL
MKGSKCTNHVLILLAALILISGSVTAITEDFNAYGARETINACACDLATDQITIHNTGDVTSTFMLDTKGTAAEWASIAPQTFYLEQGEIKTVDRFIKIPCRARGEYTLNTTIRTLFEMEKDLSQKLSVQNCNNVQIIPKFSGTQQECPCTPVQYSFDIINTGNHIETYEISVEPYSEAISLSTDLLILEPGQKEAVEVFINLECGQYGPRDFTFNALAHGTGILGQSDFTLDIKKCYEYDTIIGAEYQLCQGVPNVIPFKLQNKAIIANEYFVTVEGAEWAYPENETISAWGGETKDANILAFPTDEDEAAYTLTLKALSTRGQEEIAKDVAVQTEKCFDYQLIEPETGLKAIACKPTTYTFTLKNIGSRESIYDVDIEGLDWLKTTTNNYGIKLNPEDETQITLSGEVPCDAALGDYSEKLYVTIQEINQTYLEDKTISVFAKEDAYLPQIDLTNLEIEYEGGSAEAKITNIGFAKATYDLSIVSSDWITLDNSNVEVAPGESATVLIQAIPAEDTIEDTYAAELVARVRGEDIEYSTDFTVTLKQESGLPLWIMIAIGAGALLLIAIIVIIIVFARKKCLKEDPKKKEEKIEKENITIDKREYRRQKKEGKKTRVWPTLIVIALILLIGGAAYYAYSTGMFGGDDEEIEPEDAAAPDFEAETAPETAAAETPAKTPEPEETTTGVLTNAEIQESLITLDRSGIAGEGNELQITNETELNLPLSIKNPTDRKAALTVNAPENSWVKFDQDKVTVMPNSTAIVNVKITPDLAALEDNDYSVTINAVLDGKKIHYEEVLDLVVTKKPSLTSQYWPWALAGLAALIIIILVTRLSTGSKQPKIKHEEKPEKKEKIVEKVAKKEKRQERKEEGGKSWVGIIIGIIIIILIAAAGFWAYNKFAAGQETTEESAVEDLPAETSAEAETNASATPVEEKLTEEDVQESLITIDRSGIPGDDNTLKLDQEQYLLPISIHNPTDRKARFSVNTSNQTWVSFERYKVLVEPNNTENLNMTLTPDLEALKTNDYLIKVNTKLEGQKIDYQEELDFVVKNNTKFEAAYWMYALAGLLIIALIILIVEIAKRPKKDKKQAAAKSGKKEKKEKDLADINKEIAALRKNTMLKLKQRS